MTKILYIGFGISPFASGGAIQYQESIAKAMVALGHEVVAYYASPRYTLFPKSTPFIRKWRRDGINYLELVNPPQHWGYLNNPFNECQHKTIEKLTEDILDRERPNLVHIHELQLHSASIIAAVVDRGIPVLKTIHNYFDLCSQRDLMYKGETLCQNFSNGAQCVSCLENLPRNKIHFYYPFHLPLGGTLNSLAIKFLEKHPTSYTANKYARRRQFFIQQLNRLSCIHCSSEGSAIILKQHGVRADRIKIIPITTETSKYIKPKPMRDDKNPVVFGFVGGEHRHKGYNVLIEAFGKLNQQRVKLLIWNTAKKDPAPIPGLNVEFRGSYNPQEINEVFQEIDVGVIPSVWYEVFGLVGIEWLAAKIPVIGSDIGGIPQWLIDRQVGFLVKPGDPLALAGKMNLFIQRPTLIAEIQQKIPPPQTFEEHVDNLMKVYNILLASRRD